MYCKHCGKQIADDSSFCQYCGEKVIDELLLSENSTILPANNKNISEEGTSEVIIVTKEANPIQVEVSKKGKDNSSTIANEIVGNLKMVGVAYMYIPCLHDGGCTYSFKRCKAIRRKQLLGRKLL